MKRLVLPVLLACLGAVLVACGPTSPLAPTAPPAPAAGDLPAGDVSSANAAPPTATSEPTHERFYRSYPAPTGAAGFRRYYQKRCYPGCHDSAPIVTPTGAAHDTMVQAGATPTRERLYRSYPAPTGAAGFRRYYQKRCYPGCHTYGTPVPTRVHP